MQPQFPDVAQRGHEPSAVSTLLAIPAQFQRNDAIDSRMEREQFIAGSLHGPVDRGIR